VVSDSASHLHRLGKLLDLPCHLSQQMRMPNDYNLIETFTLLSSPRLDFRSKTETDMVLANLEKSIKQFSRDGT